MDEVYRLPKETLRLVGRALADIRTATNAKNDSDQIGALTNAKTELDRLNRLALSALAQVDPKWQ